MKIYLGSDHAGFALKQKIKEFLEKSGYEAVDLGPYANDESDAYHDFILPVAKEISHDLIGGTESKGIVFGGSGEGEAEAANRIDGVRAAVYYGGPLEIVKLSREHNNANILSIGARFVSEEAAAAAVQLWLETPFSGDERHIRRIMKF